MIDPIQLRGNTPDILDRTPRSVARSATGNRSFAATLEAQLHPSRSVRFSAHAEQRLEERGLEFSQQELRAIDEAVDTVAAKGGRETLVLTDRAALLVSVPKRTVITAMGTDEAVQNVFTNIDSAVVARTGADTAPQQTTTKGPDPLREGLGAAERLTRRTPQEM
jgi:flagellar operon protein